MWLVQGAAIYINIAAPCTTEIHTENQHLTLLVKPRVQPRFLHHLLILCFSCNPVIPKNKKSPKHFPFSVKIPIFASVPRAERSNAAKPAQLPNRYRLPNFLLFKSYLPTDYKKTIVFLINITMNQDILTDIIAHKRKEIAIQEAAVSASFLENHIGGTTVTRSMKQSLTASSTGIIAEFKRRSPSKGWINREADASIVPHSYELAGAAALSILTDELFFGGSLKDIRNARPTVNIPVLRKDFIISRYQLLQAKVAQADAVLLIAAALSKDECMSLAKEAHALQLEVLLEIHTEQETDYINEYVDMIGVNNRNLGTFHTDTENSFRLAEKFPKDKVLVSESGISNPETVIKLREAGFRGFLIGENFMKTENPGKALNEFINQLQSAL